VPIQIGSKRESDFNDPLGLLSDCHRRIEHFLDILIKICDGAAGAPLDAEHAAMLDKATTYFRNSAPKHTADEEDSLFPRLRAAGAAKPTLDCLAQMELDHQAASRDHDSVDLICRRWLTDGELAIEALAQLKQALQRLSRTYARHIAIEDNELFPLASRVLGAGDLAAVGMEMAERRGAAVTRG
jgi:hemerythrin-like domain-containing protein